MYFNNISNETYKVLRFLQLRSNVGHILKWRRTSRLPCLTNKSPPNNFVLLIKDIFHQEFLHCLGAWLKRGWTWWAHKLYFHRKFPPPFEGRIPTDSTFGTNGVIYVWNWWSPDFWSILPIGIYRLGFEMCKLKYMIVFELIDFHWSCSRLRLMEEIMRCLPYQLVQDFFHQPYVWKSIHILYKECEWISSMMHQFQSQSQCLNHPAILGGFPTNIPSRELTYPTLGKGKSSSKCHFWGIC